MNMHRFAGLMTIGKEGDLTVFDVQFLYIIKILK